MELDFDIEIFKKYIQCDSDEDGKIGPGTHVHFDELFPEQNHNDWEVDCCLTVFKNVVKRYRELGIQSRFYFYLTLPLKGVYSNIQIEPPKLKDLNDRLDDCEPPSIGVRPFESRDIIEVVSGFQFEIYKRLLSEFKVEGLKTIAYYGCSRVEERWEEYGNWIEVVCDPTA